MMVVAKAMTISNVLVVGGGSAGLRHLQNVREILPNAKLYILTRRTDLSFPGDEIEIVNSLEEARLIRPHLSIIANAASDHVETAMLLAEEGSHLFVEKPISVTTKEANLLLNLCREKAVKIAVGYNLRYSPSLIFFREKIVSGEIGSLLGFHCEVGQYLPSWRKNIAYQDSVSAKKVSGGGVLLELSHELDYLGWIFGNWSQVVSRISKVSDLDIDVEDYVSTILGFKHENSKKEIIGTLMQDFVRRDRTRFCHVIGSEKSIRWNAISNVVEIYDATREIWQQIFSEDGLSVDTYKKELQAFVNGIANNTEDFVGGIESIKAIELVEAIVQSNESNRVIYRDSF
jgi:predicted dehydrogenase